ncbi:MAG TPA: DUF2231 domain-containing protein [Gemmatimonadaceae bacterium]|nr:DUF2231 domain-containing protein [Gemmatimonadaceae bacterium]
MRSRASFKGHPLHAMLIPFPFAFLGGAFAFDLAGRWLGEPALWTTGAHLARAGIAFAMLAAIPGFIDYLGTVPPNSSGKSRATKHMVVNLSAVVLFALAAFVRGSPGVAPDPVVLGVEAAAFALLCAGGWMGGTLVYRNQIGVDHRYARAGKWSEARLEASAREQVQVATGDELEIDQMKLLHIGERRIVLARAEDGYRAFDDRCTHKGGSLAGGLMACGTVICPWHGSQFNVTTGAVCAGPAEKAITTYAVEERDGAVWLTA